MNAGKMFAAPQAGTEFMKSPITSYQAFVVAIAVLLPSCSAAYASGTYLSKEPDIIHWLQLVQTPDGKVTGQYRTEKLAPGGTIEYRTLAVTGAASSSTLSLNLQAPGLPPISIPVSGEFAGSTLTLTGGFDGDKPSTIVLVRASDRDLRDEEKALTLRADREKVAAQEKAFVVKVDELVGRMTDLSARIDADTPGLSSMEQRYQSITAKMRQYLAQESRIAGSNSGFARSQVSFTIGQGPSTTDEVHSQVESKQSTFTQLAEPLSKEVLAAAQWCRAASSAQTSGSPEVAATPSELACARLLPAIQTSRKKVDAMASLFTHLETVYETEHEAQLEIQQTSQQLAQRVEMIR